MKIVKFYADWCGPCRAMDAVLQKIKPQFNDIAWENCDIDTDPDMALKYGVMSVPTLLFLKDGVEVDRIVGSVQAGVVLNTIAANC